MLTSPKQTFFPMAYLFHLNSIFNCINHTQKIKEVRLFFYPQTLITQDLGIAVIYDPEEIKLSEKKRLTYMGTYNNMYFDILIQ